MDWLSLLSLPFLAGLFVWARNWFWSTPGIEWKRDADSVLDQGGDGPPPYSYHYLIWRSQGSKPLQPCRLCIHFSSKVIPPVVGGYHPKGKPSSDSFDPPCSEKTVYVELLDGSFEVGEAFDLMVDVESKDAQIKRIRRMAPWHKRDWKPGERARK